MRHHPPNHIRHGRRVAVTGFVISRPGQARRWFTSPAFLAMAACALVLAGCSERNPATEATALSAPKPRAVAPPPDLEDKDIVTVAGNRARLGWNARESDLTSVRVAASGLELKWQSSVFAAETVVTSTGATKSFPARVLGSPLLVDRVAVPSVGIVSLVLAATGNGWIYAVNAAQAGRNIPAPGSIVWSKQLNKPAAVNDDNYTIGVVGAPIVDLKATPPRVYVASADVAIGWQVFALDLRTGATLPGWPITIDNNTVGALNVNGGPNSSVLSWIPGFRAIQRSALNLSHDRKLLYVPFGGLRDFAPGWLVVVDTQAARIASTFAGGPGRDLVSNGGVWATTGVAIDDDGTVFTTTGNSPIGLGPATGVWGESFLALSASKDLKLTGTYTPFNYCNMEAQDADLGSTGALLIPPLEPSTTSTPRLAVFGSKQGTVYLVDRAHLPGALDRRPPCSLDSTTDKSLLPPGPRPEFGAAGPLIAFPPYSEKPWKVRTRIRTTAAYFRGANGEHYVYVTGTTKAIADSRDPSVPPAPDAGADLSNNDVPPSVIRLRIVTRSNRPAYLAIDGKQTTIAMVNPSTPVLSSDGSSNPIVWVMDAYASDAEFAVVGFEHSRPVLYAIDAKTMQPLWQTAPGELGEGGKYTIPVVKHGRVYVATDRVRAYGLP